MRRAPWVLALHTHWACPLRCSGSEGVSLLSTDAQKFKTKFEECRKEIEEREKKGDVVLVGGGLLADSLCTWLQSQAGAFFVCHRNIPEYWDCLDLSRVTQLPWDTVLSGEGAGRPSPKCMLTGLALWHLGRLSHGVWLEPYRG